MNISEKESLEYKKKFLNKLKVRQMTRNNQQIKWLTKQNVIY